MLQVLLLAQLTFPHFPHCQSSAEKSPPLLSAAFFPISMPTFFFLTNPPVGHSTSHLLHFVRLKEMTKQLNRKVYKFVAMNSSPGKIDM